MAVEAEDKKARLAVEAEERVHRIKMEIDEKETRLAAEAVERAHRIKMEIEKSARESAQAETLMKLVSMKMEGNGEHDK